MKTAFSSFIYSRKGIYGILHVLILCLSLFLITVSYTHLTLPTIA